jgi:hypothetical protein
MGLRWVRALVCASVAVCGLVGSVGATDKVSATLGGHAISLEEAGKLSCHDFDYPVIRCFSSPAALQADVARRSGAGRAAALTIGYVTVFEHATYDGAQMSLSADQPWLSSIGWNDRISSFKSFGATGRFWENSPGGGLYYVFGSTAQISYVGNTYNDKFSAFDIN